MILVPFMSLAQLDGKRQNQEDLESEWLESVLLYPKAIPLSSGAELLEDFSRSDLHPTHVRQAVASVRKVTCLRSYPRGQESGFAHMDLFLQPLNLSQCWRSSRETAVTANLSSTGWDRVPAAQETLLSRAVLVRG